MATIYTDGSSRGNPGPGGWAAIIAFEKSENNESGIKNKEWITEIGGGENDTTNNRMELMAAIKAIEFLDQYSLFNIPYSIHTDSEYVMKGITEWVHNWQAKNWRTAAKKPVLNQDLWQKLLEVSKDKKIEWKYVAGHSGDKMNDRCDEIATSFADNLSPKLYNGPKDGYK